MPPLLESLEETLPQLPLPTRIARAISQFLVEKGTLLGIIAVGAVVAFGVWARTANGKTTIQKTIMRLPWIGPLYVKQSVARIALVVGLLLRSGVLLTSAVKLAAESSTNLVYRDALYKAEEALQRGEGLAESLSDSGVFPPLATRFFSVGQDTGRLEQMLLKLASDYNRQVKAGSVRLTAMVEPVMIVVMAIAIGFLLVATILPILEAGNISQ